MKYLRYLLVGLLPLTLIPITGFSQPVNTWAKDVVMPNPNAAAFGKYGDVPVNYTSGLPSIGVPLFTLQEGPLNVPVSLSYHASGIRVGELASWVGLGWNLNGGGMINRTVLGVPDESANGYWFTGTEIDTSSGRVYICGIASGVYDGEADMFSFNFPGYSGKFFFSTDSDTSHSIYIVPQDLDLKVDVDFNPAGSFDGFTLITPEGTRYIFGKDGTRTAYENLQAGTAASSWRSSWMLLRIESADQNFSISYAYDDENYNYKTLASCKYYEGNYPGRPTTVQCPGNNGEDTANHAYVIQYVTGGRRLTSISTSTDTLVFGADTNREDIDLTAKRLDYVQYKTSESDGLCSKFQLYYDYFEDDDYTSYSYGKRLRLTKVQEYSCDNSLTKAPYEFYYEGPVVNGKQFLPNRLSKAIDHWGYYNGKHSNETTDINIPPTTLTIGISSQPAVHGSADRDSDETYMKYGVLNKIVYPTGGHTEFTFEANRVPSSSSDSVLTLIQNLATCGTLGPSCCGNLDTTHTSVVNFSSATQIDSAYFDLELADVPPPDTCFVVYTENTIEIYKADTLQGSYGFGLDPGEVYGEVSKISVSEIADLSPGIDYTFKLSSENGRSSFDLYVNDGYQYQDLQVGGLRVKEIRSSNGISSDNDLVETFQYVIEGDSSSGTLNRFPTYGQAGSFSATGDLSTYTYAMFSTDSYVPLGDYDGRHLIYERVTKRRNGNGETVYEFQEDFNTNSYQIYGPGQGFGGNSIFGPPRPELFKVKHGKLRAEYTYDISGNVVARTTHTPKSSSYEEAPGLFIKMQTLLCDPGGTSFYGFILYNPRTDAYLVASSTQTIDSVSTLTRYEYDTTETHHKPIQVTTINSEGRIREEKFKYPSDYVSSLTLGGQSNISFQHLLNKNIIAAPIETQVWEGDSTAPAMVGGTIQLFKNYGSANDTVIHPSQVFVLEAQSPIGAQSVNNSVDANGKYQLLFPSGQYEERAKFEFNESGVITDQSLVDGPPTSYLWGYGFKRPVAQIVGATYSEVLSELASAEIALNENTLSQLTDENQLFAKLQLLRARMPQALITTYTYNDRLQLSRVTQPNGLTTYYEYDKLGRLLQTKDDDGKLLQTLEYNYSSN